VGGLTGLRLAALYTESRASKDLRVIHCLSVLVVFIKDEYHKLCSRISDFYDLIQLPEVQATFSFWW